MKQSITAWYTVGASQAWNEDEVGQRASALSRNKLLHEDSKMGVPARAAPAHDLQSQPSDANRRTAGCEAAADMLSQPTDQDAFVSSPCGQLLLSHVVNDQVDHDSIPETEVCEQTSLHTAPASDASPLLQMNKGEEAGLEPKTVAAPASYDIQAMEVKERGQHEDVTMATGQMGEDEEGQMQQEELAHGPPDSSDPMEEEECHRGILESPADVGLWATGEEENPDHMAAVMADKVAESRMAFDDKNRVTGTRADAAAPDTSACATW